MPKPSLLIIAALALWGAMPSYADAAPIPRRLAEQCAKMGGLDLGPSVQIESASVAADTRRPPDVNWAGSLPPTQSDTLEPFCKVVAFSMPARTSKIRVEVWLPLSGWNGKLLGTGNGGYPDKIDYQGMAAGVVRDFAVVSTDLGLAAYLPRGGPPPGYDITDIFIDHPIATRDFATRATHEMTWIGKAVVLAFYRQAAKWSYFVGCSTGGMQGMSESQRYPEDYDAILAGDPGGNRARIHLGILWDFLSVWHLPNRVIPDAKLHMLHDAAVLECQRQTHGPAGQPFLDDPQSCRWNPEPLLCRGADAPSCLTKEQMAAAQAIYAGPRNPKTGEVYLHGLLPGSEIGWSLYMKAATLDQLPYLGVFKAALGRTLNAGQFDWDRDAETFVEVMGPQLDSHSADIRAFHDRGGKLLIYFGGADQLVPVNDMADYLSAAAELQERQEPKIPTDTFLRTKVIPGMNHCAGGLGKDRLDGLATIERWRELDVKPR